MEIQEFKRRNNGTYLKINKPVKPHVCKPPGWLNRWIDGVTADSIWQCDCRRRWILTDHEYVPGFGRPIPRYYWSRLMTYQHDELGAGDE